MKFFVVNFVLFVVTVTALNQIPIFLSGPYSGNPYYEKKIQYFTKNETDFNTVIFGSSRLYRHLNPEVFDKILEEYQISSFNLAAPATFVPEVYHLYEKFLETVDISSLKFAIVELGSIRRIRKENVYTHRNYYWHNLKYCIFSIETIFSSKLSITQKFERIKPYLLSYICKIVNFYGYEPFFDEKNDIQKGYLGENKDGFYSLNDQIRDDNENIDLQKRQHFFKKNTAALDKKAKSAKRAFASEYDEHFFNSAHFKKLIDLIEQSNKKGVHLIYIIPPRKNKSEYQKLLALKNRLPKKNILDVANPEKFPELYQVSYAFDVGHLNKSGANIFSRYTANGMLNNVLNLD